MTNEEVVRILQIMKDELILAFDHDRKEALSLAISAVEKQIPKKVRITTSTKRCSACGRQLSGIGNIHPERNYCQSCGQAIDWMENKE